MKKKKTTKKILNVLVTTLLFRHPPLPAEQRHFLPRVGWHSAQ